MEKEKKSPGILIWISLPILFTHFGYRFEMFDELTFRGNEAGGILFIYLSYFISLFFGFPMFKDYLIENIQEKYHVMLSATIISFILLAYSILIQGEDFFLFHKLLMIWLFVLFTWLIKKHPINPQQP
jgi:hypothetical protein